MHKKTKNTLTHKTPASWKNLVGSAEQHFLIYAIIINQDESLFRPMYGIYSVLFIALENFLKGYLLFIKGVDIKDLYKYSHNIEGLISECKKNNKGFLSWLKIVPKKFRDKELFFDIPEIYSKNIGINIDFYILLTRNKDLKYSGIDKQGNIYKTTVMSKPADSVNKIILEIISNLKKDPKYNSTLEQHYNYNDSLNTKTKLFLEEFI